MSMEILNTAPLSWNLAIAWLWFLLGFASGALLGLGFDRQGWLGGYTSWQRRLYRLGHISFFGTGGINLMFFITVSAAGLSGPMTAVAAWSFVVGALTMPIACIVAAVRPSAKPLFYIPVFALLAGGIITTLEVLTS
jgi:hypothetical protein